MSENDFDFQTRLASSVWNEPSSRIDDLSHFSGVGRFSNATDWSSWGRGVFAVFSEFFPAEHSNYRTLDWGPGGGAVSKVFGSISAEIWGVDLSKSSLREFVNQTRTNGGPLVKPILLDGDPLMAKIPNSHFDTVVSTATFQHFPSREYALRVLEKMFVATAPGARGLIQIRFDNGEPKFAPKSADTYKSTFVFQTSFQIESFWDNLSKVGFTPLSVTEIRTDVNYATFIFRK